MNNSTVTVLPPQVTGLAGYDSFNCKVLIYIPGVIFTLFVLFIVSIVVYFILRFIVKKTTVRFYEILLVIFTLIEIFYLVIGFWFGIELFPFPHPFVCI